MKQDKVIVLFSFLLMAACSSPVHVEKSPDVQLSNFKTYAWIQKDSLERRMELLDRNLKSSGDLYLEQLGYRAVSSDPDLLIDYDVLVERGTKQRSENVYSQPYFRPFFNPYTRRWGTIYFPSEYMGTQRYPEDVTEGTITITVIDAKTSKTVWQGWSTDEVNSRNMTAREVDHSVKSILKKLR